MKWYELNPERLAVEKRLLAKHHRGTQMRIEKAGIHIIKRIHGRYRTYKVKGIFANSHPYSPMQFYVVKPALKQGTPHRFTDGQLCLHTSADVGPETTAKVYLDWAQQWIKTYEDWLDGKPWPDTNRY
jgi:hypothetical protein